MSAPSELIERVEALVDDINANLVDEENEINLLDLLDALAVLGYKLVPCEPVEFNGETLTDAALAYFEVMGLIPQL